MRKYSIIDGVRCDMSGEYPEITEDSDPVAFYGASIERLEMQDRLSEDSVHLLNSLRQKYYAAKRDLANV
jgi:hypothetical protein